MPNFRSASTGSTQPFDKFFSLGFSRPRRNIYGTRYYDPRGTTTQRGIRKHRQKKKQRQYDRKQCVSCIE